ncbi:hypothetical protein [Pseudoclavibacter sp. JSM 162008]|uniref:hypothetical protein n=1 Tax=Pseudoclavibacter sp. JSM 162008 TaxID=3229855 RepID=UPI003525931A
MSGRTDDLAQTAPKPSWKAFWERSGWWKAVVLVVAYYVLYQLGGLLFLPF